MICPRCKYESINFDTCPYCKYDLTTVPNPFETIKINEEYKKIRKRLNIFYYIVIAIGSIILIFLIFNLFNKKDNKAIDNKVNTNRATTQEIIDKGYVDSNPVTPAKFGELTKASLQHNGEYYEVFVKGIRKIDSIEASNILTSHGLTYDIRYGFNLEGIEYEISLIDDLNDVNPVLKSNYYLTDTGYDYLNINDDIFRIKTVDIYDGNNISKDDKASVIVIYQTNENRHSICLGNRSYKAGCIDASNIE